jgi:hypothetical protein
MNILLTPELERYIQGKVACGIYNSASEVIRESLRLIHACDGVIPILTNNFYKNRPFFRLALLLILPIAMTITCNQRLARLKNISVFNNKIFIRIGIRKQRIAELNQAINLGLEQLQQKQEIDGKTSGENMKRRIDAIAKGN